MYLAETRTDFSNEEARVCVGQLGQLLHNRIDYTVWQSVTTQGE